MAPTNFDLMREAVLRQLPGASDPSARARVEKLFKDGEIVSARFGTLPFKNGDIWADTSKRSQARYVHGFLFLSDWHRTVLCDPVAGPDYAAFALSVTRTWSANYGDATRIPEVSHHDETTAQRLIQLTALLPRLKGLLPADDYNWLGALALDTARLLATDDFHATGNNHGMFQDLSLLYFSVVCDFVSAEEREDLFATATARLHSYFSTSFTSDGVHVENTPTYHLMVSKHVHDVLGILSQTGHHHADYYRSLIRNAAEYATHALMPNGMYPPISDTTQQLETGAARQNIFDSSEFAYAASGGKIGSKPHQRTLVLPDSGYAIYRSAWGNPKASFAFFSAAYNANYHKHSDDLSLFLRSDGVDLLSEAGAYGYDYKDPLTKYGYSSYAHNCIVVDGISLPRTDDSAHLTTMEAHEVRADGYRVTGRTGRLRNTTHSRTVDIQERNGIPSLEVSDIIESQEEHSYELLWNLGPDVETVIHGQGFELFQNGRKVMDLQFDANVPTSVSLHKGEKRPRYLGWRFPRFGEAVPSPVVKISFQGKHAHLKTRIRLAEFNYLDRGLNDKSAGWQRSIGKVGLNYLSVPASSDAGGGKLTVVFTAIHQPGDFTYNYRKSVDEAGTHAIYILDDFGDQGSYYLTDHRDNSIFESTQALIHQELQRLGLAAKDLITAGSSKGGTAAILHGISAGAGRIIVGAPQVKIGSFVRDPHPNMLGFMMGDTSEDSVATLDAVVFDAIDDMTATTRLSILVGEADHHYKNHVLPLMSHAEANHKEIDLTVLPGLPHAEIGAEYRKFLTEKIQEEAPGDDRDTVHYTLRASGGEPAELCLTVRVAAGWELASRLFRGAESVARTPYGPDGTVVWNDLPTGRYRARVFLRNTAEDVVRTITTTWVILPG
ncbi:heparinase II/III family protein [Pseudarthrobacter sp. PH31-O2]|uniref:heparinase II/III domain-containing protein n=1 Tax=Pseudarthrobacter sp. PH31-O2 TaxID=3046206 RepID=UPI0024B97799|nr:heparinase II/III family protein [Pseudarthrobacter sp. PH31-O2]MDJ0351364.1 heparinase II/III family protein [Pseudarthrobacter sp. PH31-O2]